QSFGNQLNALNSLGSTYATGQGQALSAANSASDILAGNRSAQAGAASNVAQMQSANADRRLGALGQLFNAGQTGMGNTANAANVYRSLLDAQNAPGQNLMDIGSMYEDLYGRTLNDQLRIANEAQNAPLSNIRALLAAAAGAGGYSTGTQTAQGP